MTGKVAFVSGGAGGLGAAICRRLAGEGAGVAVADIDLARAEALAAEITAEGGQAAGVQLDASSGTSVREAVEQIVERFGRCDFLVHAAGNTAIAPILDLAEADWRSVLEIGRASCRERV